MEIIKVRLDQIDPNPYQPETRIQLKPETIEFYARSILEHGLLQTPLVRQAPYGKKGERYQMGDGWGRRCAFVHLVQMGHPEYGELPVEVRDLTDEAMAQLVFEANGVRKDLNPLEQALFFKKYLDEFHITQDALAKKLCITQGEVANTIRLLQLPQEVQYLVAAGTVPQTHARHLLRLNVMPAEQEKAIKQVVQGKVSVTELERDIDRALWDSSKSLDTTTSVSERPVFDMAECQKCAKRTQAKYPWGDNRPQDRCLDAACWEKKQKDAEKARDQKNIEAAQTAKEKGGEKVFTSRTLQSGKYEMLYLFDTSRPDFDRTACRTCDKKGKFKYTDDSTEVLNICLDPACMRAKKSAFTRAKNKDDKEADRELTKRLGVVFHKAGQHPLGAMMVFARYALTHLQADDKRDIAFLFPNLPNISNGQLDQDGVLAKLHTMSFEEVCGLAVAAIVTPQRRCSNYSWSSNQFSTELTGDLLHDMAHLEGRFPAFLEETTKWQEANCRVCHNAKAVLIGSGLECCGQTYNKKITKEGFCQSGQEAKRQAEKDVADRAAEKPAPAARVVDEVVEHPVPAGVRQPHEVPRDECEKCGLGPTDHTLGFKFVKRDPTSQGGKAYLKVCIKDYRAWEKIAPTAESAVAPTPALAPPGFVDKSPAETLAYLSGKKPVAAVAPTTKSGDLIHALHTNTPTPDLDRLDKPQVARSDITPHYRADYGPDGNLVEAFVLPNVLEDLDATYVKRLTKGHPKLTRMVNFLGRDYYEVARMTTAANKITDCGCFYLVQNDKPPTGSQTVTYKDTTYVLTGRQVWFHPLDTGKQNAPPPEPEAIQVDKAELEKLAVMNSCDTIGEKNPRLRGIYDLNGNQYACTGSMSTGADGVLEATCYHVKPSESYSGKSHAFRPGTGHGYDGVCASFHGKQYVLFGQPIKFTPTTYPTVTTTPPLATMPPATQAAVTELATAATKQIKDQTGRKDQDQTTTANTHSEEMHKSGPATHDPTKTETKTVKSAAQPNGAAAPSTGVKEIEPSELKTGKRKAASAKHKIARGRSAPSSEHSPAAASGNGASPTDTIV